jgi:2-oxoglutarate ferredoxin oxidoreductase subunit alpha
VLLFPEDPHECFEHARAALDLADRLQTPVFVMTDLDIGMNQRLCEPFAWDDAAQLRPRQGHDRRGTGGRQGLRPLQGRRRRRHPLAHLPGTHPTKGSYFTRGTTRDPYARYSERGPDYIYNVERLLKKFAPPPPWCRSRCCARRQQKTRLGVIYFGSTSPAMHEALDVLARAASTSTRCGCAPSRSRSRCRVHRRARQVFVVEQNRDAQMHSLLVNELEIDPARLVRCCTTTARRSPRASSPDPNVAGAAPCTRRHAKPGQEAA